MPVPCLQVTGEDSESAATGETGEKDGWGSGNKLHSPSLRTKGSFQWRFISSFSTALISIFFSSSNLHRPLPIPSRGLPSPRLCEETCRLKKYSWLVWLMTPQRAIGFPGPRRVFLSVAPPSSLSFHSLTLFPPSLSFSLALSVKHRFILPVMCGALWVLRDRVSWREVCVQ